MDITHPDRVVPPDDDEAPGARERKVYLVGGGIASLAAAVFLIRDGDVLGRNITILEESGKIGGSLDGAGSPRDGYILRGGRMIESKYLCTYDLFSSIPTLDGSRTVTDEIFAWNETIRTSSKSRLVRDGRRVTAPDFGLSERHILAIERLVIESEGMLGRSTIADQFDLAFFETNFWFMWCTTFAFQPWHGAVEFRRYLLRFANMVSGFSRLEGIMRTVYNQYDSMVRPIHKWLDERKVVFALGTEVTDLRFRGPQEAESVATIVCRSGPDFRDIAVHPRDLVLVTLGSMTEASSLGAMDQAPILKDRTDGGAWSLWETIAAGRPQFGRPSVFSEHVDQSKWVSFTTTLRDPIFLNMLLDVTGNVPGEGGLVTFPQSKWLVSIVAPHQPHFIGQPKDVSVLWGYGLAVDEPGDFVGKPMSACTGREIMTEVMGHLRVTPEAQAGILARSTCIPCMMPFITSQFLRREAGDRPQIVPEGAKNLAFIGQFCEQPYDVVFTVEYSVRSAQVATYSLLGLKCKPPPVYQGRFDPRVLAGAFLALHDVQA